MPDEVPAGDERNGTHLALMVFDSGVALLVVPASYATKERGVAHVALEWAFPRLPGFGMNRLVFYQVRFIRESFATVSANKRPIPHVHVPVCFESVLLRKKLPADGALVLVRLHVRPHVRVALLSAEKARVADTAFVVAFLLVGAAHMLVEQTPRVVRL